MWEVMNECSTKIGLGDGYSLPCAVFPKLYTLEVQDTPSVKDESVVAIIQYLQYTGNSYDTIRRSYTMKKFSPCKKVHLVSFMGHFIALYEQPIPLNRKLHCHHK